MDAGTRSTRTGGATARRFNGRGFLKGRGIGSRFYRIPSRNYPRPRNRAKALGPPLPLFLRVYSDELMRQRPRNRQRISVTFNNADYSIGSLEQLSIALARFNQHPDFELLMNKREGPTLAMLRNREHALLLYTPVLGHHGYLSRGTASSGTYIVFTFADGYVGPFSLKWCIPLEQCYEAVKYFFANDGARPDGVSWQDCP